jgi:hypothetical protein
MTIHFQASAGRGRKLHGKSGRGISLRALAVLLVGVCRPGLPVVAAQTDPGGDRDMRHTILARHALQHDSVLAPLNLGVRVHNRVATLWGPVPSPELKERAVRVLRQVPDLLEVRSQLHVAELEEPAQESPDRLPPAPGPPSTPTALPGFPKVEPAWRGTLVERSTDQRAFASPVERVQLRPGKGATPPEEEGPEVAVLPAIRISGPGATVQPADTLALAVDRLRLRDARFQRLRAEALGREVRLSGAAERWQDVDDFAGALMHLPGVERVVIDRIRTDSGSR